MAQSKRLHDLTSRISFLETSMLPNIKISGNYTKKESDLIRSYVVLVHAEIEAYFEDIAKEKASKSLQKWMQNRQKSNCLTSIMSFHSPDINWEKQSRENRISLEYRINLVVNHYINTLNNNHGIKRDNLYNILLPLGLEITQLDETWLGIMNSFGSTRGSIAHSTHSIQAQIDLTTEKNRINNQILPEISTIDNLIRKIS